MTQKRCELNVAYTSPSPLKKSLFWHMIQI